MGNIKLYVYYLVYFILTSYMCQETEEDIDDTEDWIDISTPFTGVSTIGNFNQTYAFEGNTTKMSQNLTIEEINQTSITSFDITTNNPNYTITTPQQCAENLVLPVKGPTEEIHNSFKILLILFVIVFCFLAIHFILSYNLNYIPESMVVICIGAATGALFKLFPDKVLGDLAKKEMFNPTTFFLFLLPPIIYESSYNLHKGNFFRNIGSILIFAIVGTGFSALAVGVVLYFLGEAKLIYRLSFAESFVFGSFISAVDPVGTLGIFQALEVEPVLSMLVIGESILNDAVAIVLSSAVWKAAQDPNAANTPLSQTIVRITMIFVTNFFASAIIGMMFALAASLLFKHVELRKNPSLEFGMMLIFIYAPYCLAEGLQLSGIIAILFNGIVMSHYTHFNLSPVAQQIMQVTLRTMAFIAETCVFAYLGLAIFSFRLVVKPGFLFASLFLCLLGRALTIYPISFFVNIYRTHKITPKMMFIIWFSGIRGAVSFALALRFEFADEKRDVIITTTLLIVLLTTLVLGVGTMPLLKFLQNDLKSEVWQSEVCLSKTEKLGHTIETDLISEDEEYSYNQTGNKFVSFDSKYLLPFFTRRRDSRSGSDVGSWQEFSKDWHKKTEHHSIEDDED